MALKLSFPAPTGVGISSADSRAALSGLFARDVDGVPRAGLFPPAGAIVTARASMGVNVASFDALLVRAGLPAAFTNDGTIVVPIGAAPGANFRYHIVYVKQNETQSPFTDTNDEPVCTFVAGAASATPNLAAAIALVPAGGLPLAAVLLPAGALTTQSAGVTITPLFQYAAMQGSPVHFRTRAEMDAWEDAAPSQRAYVIDTQMTYEYGAALTGSPAGWYPIPGSLIRGRARRTLRWDKSDGSARAAVPLALDAGFSRGGVTATGTDGLIVPYTGEYEVVGRWNWQSNGDGSRLCSFFIDGVEVAPGVRSAHRAALAVGHYDHVAETVTLNEGQRITLGAAQTSGGTIGLEPESTDIRVFWKGRG
ncbi:hypothetical protein [Marisediminicola sp. LYQ134]|uniref:hypothetical protein n=1 Tax=Marisediminicola sp. LYQ134 TaxID=3391061 RepID=UPI0039838D04